MKFDFLYLLVDLFSMNQTVQSVFEADFLFLSQAEQVHNFFPVEATVSPYITTNTLQIFSPFAEAFIPIENNYKLELLKLRTDTLLTNISQKRGPTMAVSQLCRCNTSGCFPHFTI